MIQNNPLVEKITRIIIETVHPIKVIVFGSFARGEQEEQSDIDIMVIKEDMKPRSIRAREIRRQLRGIKFPVDIMVYTPAEISEWEHVPNSFVYSVLHDGIKVYG